MWIAWMPLSCPEPAGRNQAGFCRRLNFFSRSSQTASLSPEWRLWSAPPYDAAEITASISTRVIMDVLACQARSGHLPIREKPVRGMTGRTGQITPTYTHFRILRFAASCG